MSSMPNTLAWGIIGTGAIAGDFAQALRASRRCSVVSVSGTSREKAEAFAQRFELPRAARSLEELLADPGVGAVYVATPHPAHEASAMRAIAAGKHVLCEKPLTVDAGSSARLIEAARMQGVFLLEAYMYRSHPIMERLLSALNEGAIGTVRHVSADFTFRAERDPKGRLFDPAQAGGGILDVGGYPMSFARLLAGLRESKPFAEPTSLQASGIIGPTGVDEHAAALLEFQSGMTASISCGIHGEIGRAARIAGDAGHIQFDAPWTPQGGRHGLRNSFVIHRAGARPETVSVECDKATYAIQAELVLDSLPAQEAAWPAMTWADTLGNMRALEAWRAAVDRRAIKLDQA